MWDELTEKACDFAADFRDNYDNTYWWADHPALRITAISVIAGGIGLLFHYVQLRMDAHVLGSTP